jgi:hypothetical protein
MTHLQLHQTPNSVSSEPGAGQTIIFSMMFLFAVAKYPIPNNYEGTVFWGLYLAMGSGIAWGVSVLGASTAWNSFFNYIAALLTLLSVAYLTSIDSVCSKNQTNMFCVVSKWVATP